MHTRLHRLLRCSANSSTKVDDASLHACILVWVSHAPHDWLKFSIDEKGTKHRFLPHVYVFLLFSSHLKDLCLLVCLFSYCLVLVWCDWILVAWNDDINNVAMSSQWVSVCVCNSTCLCLCVVSLTRTTLRTSAVICVSLCLWILISPLRSPCLLHLDAVPVTNQDLLLIHIKNETVCLSHSVYKSALFCRVTCLSHMHNKRHDASSLPLCLALRTSLVLRWSRLGFECADCDW